MDSEAPQARGVVLAPLHYLLPTGQRPFSYACEPPPGVPWESHDYERREMPIGDGRRRQPLSGIDAEGYTLVDAPTRVDFDDDDEVWTHHYPEAVELALAVTGARAAFVFDHLLRRRAALAGALDFGRRGGDGRAGANARIHNDYTEASGLRRLALVLQDDEALARTERFAIVSIWRPLRDVVVDAPLALCDARPILAGELVDSEVRYAHRTGEIYHLRHSPRHAWSYFAEMRPAEALVFKQFDSQLSGVARFVPHAAFEHPATPAEAPPRESVELRCLVVY
jgi:hypothetical protein